MPTELIAASSGIHMIPPQCPGDELQAMWSALEQPGLPLGPFHFSLSRLCAMQQQCPDAQHQDAPTASPAKHIKGKVTTRAGRPASSKYKGVNLHCRSNRWDAHIWDGRQVHLGCFLFEIQAAIAYDLMAIKVRGCKAANMNFSVDDYKKEVEQLEQISKEVLVASLRVSTTKLRAVTEQLPNDSPEMLRLQSMLSSKPQPKPDPEATPAPTAPPPRPTSSSSSYPSKCRTCRTPAPSVLAKRRRREEASSANSPTSTLPQQPATYCICPTHPTPPLEPTSPHSSIQAALKRHCAALSSRPYPAACPPRALPAPHSVHHRASAIGPISAPSFQATLDWLAQTFPEQYAARALPARPPSTLSHALAPTPMSLHTPHDASDPHPPRHLNPLRVQLPPHTPLSPTLDMHPQTPMLSPSSSISTPSAAWPQPTFTILPPKLLSAAYTAYIHQVPHAPIPPHHAATAAQQQPRYHNPHTLFDLPCAPSPSYRSRQGLAQQQQQQQACSEGLQLPSSLQGTAGLPQLPPNRLIGLHPPQEEEAPYVTSAGTFCSVFQLPSKQASLPPALELEQGSFPSAPEPEQGSFPSAPEPEQGSFPSAPEPEHHCDRSSIRAASPPPTLPSDSSPISPSPALQADLDVEQFDVVAESAPGQWGGALLTLPSAASSAFPLPKALHATRAPLEGCSSSSHNTPAPLQRCTSPLPLWHPGSPAPSCIPGRCDAARVASSPLQYSWLLGSPSVCTPQRLAASRGGRTPQGCAGPARSCSPAWESLQGCGRAQLLQPYAELQAFGDVPERGGLQLGREQYDGGDSYGGLQAFVDAQQCGSPPQYGAASLGNDASLSDGAEELRVCYDLLERLDCASHAVHDARLSLKQWEQDILGAGLEGGCEGGHMQQQALEDEQVHQDLAACLRCFVN